MKNIKEIKISNINPNKIGIIIGIIIFILTILGVTYAYVEPTFYNNKVIGFSAIENTEDKNKIKITENKEYMKNLLIPINEEDIYKAINRENICIDDKGQYVCSLYQFTIKNTWDASQKLQLSLYTENNTFGNYYFMLFKSKINNINKSNQIIESTHLTQDLIGQNYTLPNVEPLLEPGQQVTYTILFYVKAIEMSQTSQDKGKNFTGHININSISTGYMEDDEFSDVGGVWIEKPDIENTGLVPIKYNGTNWIVTTETDKEWYDYAEQKWANAASLKTGVSTTPGTVLSTDNDIYAMFVWIPRFSYTIGCTSSTSCLGYKINKASDLAVATPGAIDIKFISVDEKEDPGVANGTYPNYTYTSESDRNPTNWYTHPAFTFGDKELPGIWIGKFETTGTSTTPTILPNVTSLRSQTVSVQFATAQKFSASGNVYGITGDAHMAKNSEWAAVAYLSQSIYGKYGNSSYSGALKEIYINDSNSYYTGRSEGTAPGTSSYSSSGTYKYDVEINGTGASTTGNIYGVYDMAGGAWEYVMANYNNTVSSGGFSSSWFTTEGHAKYYDKLTTTTPFTTKSKETIGQAFIETAGWYSDGTSTFSTTSPWLTRGGGSGAGGVFNGGLSDGPGTSSFGFRTALVVTGA